VQRHQRGDKIELEAARLLLPRLRQTSGSRNSRKVCAGLSDEATNFRARIVRPSIVSMPAARPFSTTMRLLGVEHDIAARFANGSSDRLGKPRSPALGHLRLCGRGQKHGDVMPEALHPHIHFAQAVEEDETGLHDGMLELALHELERR
jgi:hypothetical protein